MSRQDLTVIDQSPSRCFVSKNRGTAMPPTLRSPSAPGPPPPRPPQPSHPHAVQCYPRFSVQLDNSLRQSGSKQYNIGSTCVYSPASDLGPSLEPSNRRHTFPQRTGRNRVPNVDPPHSKNVLRVRMCRAEKLRTATTIGCYSRIPFAPGTLINLPVLASVRTKGRSSFEFATADSRVSAPGRWLRRQGGGG